MSARDRAPSSARTSRRRAPRRGAPATSAPGPGGRAGARGRERRLRRSPRSLRAGDERSDDHEAIGLVALAVGLDPGAVLEPVVDDTALLRRHRLEVHRAASLDRPVGGLVGLALELLALALAVAGRVDLDALAVL